MDSEIDRTTETRESAVEMDSSNFEAEIPQNNNPEEIDQHKIDLETLIDDGKEDSTEPIKNSELEETSQSSEKNSDSNQFTCNFLIKPREVATATIEFNQEPENFLKGCKWAPDGLCILTASSDSKLRIFNSPQDLITPLNGQDEEHESSEINSVISVEDGDMIYDYAWYPGMSSTDPQTCCFVTTSRRSPVHLFDAFDGHLRASYRSYDNVDEMTAVYSVNFNADGDKLICGLNQQINVFDISNPGREYSSIKTAKKSVGQKGIISCVANCPQQPKIFAAGSYSTSTAIYCEHTLTAQMMFEGQVGGVTHLLFSNDGYYLFAGGRKDPEIICWDIRVGGIVYCLKRRVETNQRMFFDLDPSGRYLISGNHNQAISIWDLKSPPKDVQNEPILIPLAVHKLHNDVINGISIHPSLPILATGSGERKFPFPDQYDSDDSEPETNKSELFDNSLKFWRWTLT